MDSVHIGLVDPKSPENMGSVLRAVGCYQATAIRYTGSRYARASQFVTDTKKRHLAVDIKRVEDLISEAKAAGLQPVAVELTLGATPLPNFQHPKQCMYIFGPEDGTIPQSVVDQCADIVFIPTTGCMNLAATVNVILYDRLAKQYVTPQDHAKMNALILQSRDTNNRTTRAKKA
jgi:tRNA(Leu) C34 or U34 (ribose-2'-O)-methylase TrmL